MDPSTLAPEKYLIGPCVNRSAPSLEFLQWVTVRVNDVYDDLLAKELFWFYWWTTGFMNSCQKGPVLKSADNFNAQQNSVLGPNYKPTLWWLEESGSFRPSCMPYPWTQDFQSLKMLVPQTISCWALHVKSKLCMMCWLETLGFLWWKGLKP